MGTTHAVVSRVHLHDRRVHPIVDYPKLTRDRQRNLVDFRRGVRARRHCLAHGGDDFCVRLLLRVFDCFGSHIAYCFGTVSCYLIDCVAARFLYRVADSVHASMDRVDGQGQIKFLYPLDELGTSCCLVYMLSPINNELEPLFDVLALFKGILNGTFLVVFSVGIVHLGEIVEDAFQHVQYMQALVHGTEGGRCTLLNFPRGVFHEKASLVFFFCHPSESFGCIIIQSRDFFLQRTHDIPQTVTAELCNRVGCMRGRLCHQRFSLARSVLHRPGCFLNRPTQRLCYFFR